MHSCLSESRLKKPCPCPSLKMSGSDVVAPANRTRVFLNQQRKTWTKTQREGQCTWEQGQLFFPSISIFLFSPPTTLSLMVLLVNLPSEWKHLPLTVTAVPVTLLFPVLCCVFRLYALFLMIFLSPAPGISSPCVHIKSLSASMSLPYMCFFFCLMLMSVAGILLLSVSGKKMQHFPVEALGSSHPSSSFHAYHLCVCTVMLPDWKKQQQENQLQFSFLTNVSNVASVFLFFFCFHLSFLDFFLLIRSFISSRCLYHPCSLTVNIVY